MPGSFHTMSSSEGPSMLQHVSELHSFLWPNHITLYVYATFYLHIDQNLGYLHLLATGNNAAMRNDILASLCNSQRSVFWVCAWGWNCLVVGTSVFNVLRDILILCEISKVGKFTQTKSRIEITKGSGEGEMRNQWVQSFTLG